MSDIKINNITDRTGDSGPIFAGISTVSTNAFMVMPSGPTEFRGGRGKGVFAGGGTPAKSDVINTVQIATTANATDFGNLSVAKNGVAALASATRGVFGGGYTPTQQSTIEYLNFQSGGGVNDFGELLVANNDEMSGSNNTIGIFSRETTTQFIIIASTGDATDWGGDTTRSRYFGMQSNCSPTRMVIGGGYFAPATPFTNTLEFVQIATTGDSTDFGDLTILQYAGAGASDSHGGLGD